MDSRVAVVALVVMLAGCADARNEPVSTSTTAPATSTTVAGTVVEIEIVGGKVVTANKRPTVERGDLVRFVVRSDVSEQVHVHGYDRLLDVKPGQAAELSFAADISGVFEVELERGHKRILDLEVSG
jgi:hypothetical protein